MKGAVAGYRREWRRRWRDLTRIGSIVGGILMALLLIFGILHSIPSRSAVDSLSNGREYLRRGDYEAAERNFNAVLRQVPESAVARLGLACAYYLTGDRSVAALELTHGLDAGVFAEQPGSCGHGLRLEDAFLVAKLGLSDAFAVPRVAGASRFEATLTSEPSSTNSNEPARLLIGACLATRAGLLGTAWEYAGSALENAAFGPADRVAFLSCFDRREQQRVGCASRPSIGKCVMTASAKRAYFDDIRLVDAPIWHEPSGG
jgi:hypothetical protein